jgi:hypothetical protein
MGEFGLIWLLVFQLLPQCAELPEAGLRPRATDILRATIEQERVFFRVGRRAGGGRMGAEIGLRERHAEGGVRW